MENCVDKTQSILQDTQFLIYTSKRDLSELIIVRLRTLSANPVTQTHILYLYLKYIYIYVYTYVFVCVCVQVCMHAYIIQYACARH